MQIGYSDYYAGKEHCVELLMSHGLCLDEVDVYGQTPMFYAASENQVEVIRRFANKGILYSIQNASIT